MALVFPGSTRCAICDGVVQAEDSLFATSGVWLPPEHPLFRFCDAAMHEDCYARWPHRAELARTLADWRAESFYWGVPILRTDSVLVKLVPRGDTLEVLVVPTATGIVHNVPLRDWEAWLADEKVELHPVLGAALREVLPLLQGTLPTARDVQSRADWEPMIESRERARKLHEAEEAAREARFVAKSTRTDALLERLATSDLDCPHCGAGRRDHRHRARGPHHESFFICSSCGRSFTADDLA
ncbi:MAG: hypothetical protein M5U28_43040 [Sandaracinaceae bacterium]|nr:hypothetical protein [Sandaracinaceae bacterium]